MLIDLFVSRYQNNKDGDTLEKALTFQTETNILHHYKGILLLKLLWQNQNLSTHFVFDSKLIPRDLAHCQRRGSSSRAVTQIPRDQSH